VACVVAWAVCTIASRVVVITAPRHSFLQSALPETEIFMAGIMSLNCSILGPDVDNAFPVEIPRGKTVGALKGAIKRENAPKLDHIAAHELDVWKVGILHDEGHHD